MDRARSASILIALSLLALVDRLDAVVYTVGFDATRCTHSDLQTAIDEIPGNAGDEIRVANDQIYFSQALEIHGKSLLIEGGYATCSDSAPTQPLERTELIGNIAERVLDVRATAPRSAQPTVELRNLRLRSGKASEGAGIRAASVTLRLEEVDISLNEATSEGGGIFADHATIRMSNSRVTSNESGGNGGGILCQDCILDLIVDNVIEGNDAQYGGGIAAYGTGASVHLGPGNRVAFNRAGAGGGLSLSSYLEATIQGTAENPVLIENNLAGHVGTPRVMGGGITLGHHADLTASHLILRDNAVQNPTSIHDCGAGIAVDGDAEAFLHGENTNSILFSGNAAAHGSAACVWGDGSLLQLAGVVIRDQIPRDGAASSLLQVHFFGSLEAEGLVLAENEVVYLVRALGSGTARIAHATTYLNSGIGGGPIGAVLFAQERSSSHPTVDWYSSILWEATPSDFVPLNTTPETLLSSECMMISGTPQNLPAMTYLITGSWTDIWAGAHAGNFRLHEDSPAIDFCDPTVYDPEWTDYDGGLRGIDDPTVTDNYSGALLDLGADEYGSAAPPASIFADAFESGDTARWNG